ncbi:type VI secretion system-associated FHA domain protein TagH [Chromatium okenii]|uniref:type VI secretion system-associated FHA domain protein TagH n=1 Tax=Chromatium okenii TaxID=61644 RepID=UPI0026EBC27E|nr:type VI secretion system-associated FHA domain protein TagH [Chromatium okenii]MBV5311068.1 type VI secretion system-associated FHA domain protein TagH [Chromatium okenii]
MDVNLHIVNTQLQTPAWDVQLQLTARGITLGRHPSSDVHLDDPERVISGQHARLEARNGGLWITDISRNGTYLNNANDPLPSQQPVAISAGDRLVIGSFNITITVNGQQLSSAVEVADSPQDAAGLLNTQPTPDILDLLNPSIGGQTAADFIPPAARGASATATASFNSTLDGFAPAAPAREMRPPPTPVEHVCYRPAAMPDDYDLLNDAWRNAAPPPKSPDTIATASASPPSAVNAELSAFFAGLGIEQPATAPQAEVLFRQAGELLRVFATGLSMTLMARAQFKNELRLGVTTIRAAENNPFKFSVDTDSLLKQLLLRSNPGFLPAVIAAQAGFDDIQAHEMAMTAGLQAALRALFARFDPTELERQLSNSGINPVLPMARKARCWELFAETYEQMAAEASEDFMQLFDTSFARAYQEQIRRLTEMHRTSRGS